MIDSIEDNEITILNCRLYSSIDDERVDILVENGKIAYIGKISGSRKTSRQVNADGRIAAPGFIDVHIQGAGGADILDASADSLMTMSKTLAKFGTTGFLATTVFHSDRDNEHLKKVVEFMKQKAAGAQIFGIHLEGPFINSEKKGGLATSSIHEPSMRLLDEIFEVTGESLAMMTIAPELNGNMKLIERLAANGVIASFGHSAADYKATKQGIRAGISHVTHLFNAMPGFHHRTPGPLHALFEAKDVCMQVISDGVHLHPETVRLIHRMIGFDRCTCITDGIQAIGLPEGRYVYNGREYESRNGAARYLDGTLIGTSISLNEIARRFMEYTGCSLTEAVRTVSHVPARVLGLHHRKGDIAIGMDADLVIMDDDFNISMTFINGKLVFQKERS